MASAEGQQHPLGIYYKIWVLLFVLSAFSYAVDYFDVQGAMQLKELGVTREKVPNGVLYEGRGCDACLGRGLFDRTAIYELFQIDEQARDDIIQQTSASIVKQRAVERGLKTLRMDGARKVLEGATTIEEVFRVTQLDVF